MIGIQNARGFRDRVLEQREIYLTANRAAAGMKTRQPALEPLTESSEVLRGNSCSNFDPAVSLRELPANGFNLFEVSEHE